MKNCLDLIIQHLISGGQISNGTQNISFNKALSKGYLCCDDPDCCNADFISMDEIIEYIESNDWYVV